MRSQVVFPAVLHDETLDVAGKNSALAFGPVSSVGQYASCVDDLFSDFTNLLSISISILSRTVL